MARTKDDLPATGADLYEQDFALWIEEQAGLLRLRAFDRLDLDNLIDELEGMSRSDKRSLNSDIVVVIKHLLKYRFQTSRRSRSWLSSIEEHRQRVKDGLQDSPSLEHHVAASFQRNYTRARRQAIIETGLSAKRFPDNSPWTLEQVLDPDFLPD